MADVKPGPEYSRAHHDDIREYLVDKGISGRCHLCGHDSFTINHVSETTVPGLIVQSTADFSLEGVVPVVIMECDNCGNLNMFRERKVHDYIVDKRRQAENKK